MPLCRHTGAKRSFRSIYEARLSLKKRRGGSKLWEKVLFGSRVSVFGLQDPFLRMHQHHKSRNSASPSQRLLIFRSLRFMSKQDNSSSGAVFFPPFLGSLHTNISGSVSGNYTFLLWHKDAKPLWCCAALHASGAGCHALMGDIVQSERWEKQKKMIKGSFWSRDVLFYTGISAFAPRRWAEM